MQTKQEYIALPIDGANKIASYLASRPWIEANPLLQILQVAVPGAPLPAYQPQENEPAPQVEIKSEE